MDVPRQRSDGVLAVSYGVAMYAVGAELEGTQLDDNEILISTPSLTAS